MPTLELASCYVAGSPVLWATWIAAGAGLMLHLRGRSNGRSLILAAAQVGALWAAFSWYLSVVGMTHPTFRDLSAPAAAGLVAAPVPALCALLARLPSRMLFLGILVPWIDYSLLTLGFLGLIVRGWGLGADRLW